MIASFKYETELHNFVLVYFHPRTIICCIHFTDFNNAWFIHETRCFVKYYSPAGIKVWKSFFCIKVTIKVMWCHLKGHLKWSIHAKYEVSISYSSFEFGCLRSHATIFQLYMWQHRCAGAMKKKFDLRSGSRCHRHFLGFPDIIIIYGWTVITVITSKKWYWLTVITVFLSHAN